MLQSGGRHLLKFLRHTISVFVFIPVNVAQPETAISFYLKNSYREIINILLYFVHQRDCKTIYPLM